ncbi:helix-turn-helix domain-containing protein [Lactobacillus xylocopicola]|uniref:Transcriptional regulator n=1 Tax=Lactobacillus xylocopicola TaxID=2976676 RepID=A0ABM8BG55_9LACO|nr:helix-turn-helix domain-containing protein [Lactobacillus xylocopicola]BDR60229.1 transcriptional regulator [Lactobacillus xylocopicola]
MADIGEKLQHAREAKGFSIEDVEKATKIQSRYLIAIEQNDFAKLPGDFYVRAFIRQYAQIVGLDGKQLLSEYHKEIPKAEPEEYVEESLDNKSEEVRKTTSKKKKLWQDYLPRIIIGLGVVVVLLVCYVVYAHFSANNNQDNSANDVAVSSESSQKRKKSRPKVVNPVKIRQLADNQYQVTGLKKNGNRDLVVRAGDQATTVTITMNGVSQGAQPLAAGQKHTLKLPANVQSVVVTLSNASGTAISIGKKKVPYNGQNTGLSLTFLIGKRNSNQNQANSTNSNQHQQSDSTVNNSNSNQTNTNQGQQSQQNQGQHQSTGNNTTNNNQHSGQSTQNNQQTGHGNNQTNGSDQNKQSGSDSANNDGDKK